MVEKWAIMVRNDGLAATRVLDVHDDMALISPLFGPGVERATRGRGGWVHVSFLERYFHHHSS